MSKDKVPNGNQEPIEQQDAPQFVLDEATLEIRPEEGGFEDIENDTELRKRRILTAIEAVSLALGSTTLSYNFVEGLELDPALSFALRAGIGVTSGFIYDQSWKLVARYLGGASAITHFFSKNYLKAGVGITHSLAGAAALGSSLLTAKAIGEDYFKNRIVVDELSEAEYRMNEVQSYPDQHQEFVRLESELYEEIIQALDEDGELTPEAAALMRLVNDGDSIVWSPSYVDHSLGEVLIKHTFEHNNNMWTITKKEEHTYWIQGPEHSWLVGPNVHGANINQWTEQRFPRDKAFRKHNKVLESSGLLDGISAHTDFLAEVGDLPEAPVLLGSTEVMNPFIPTEWNEQWRDKLRNESKLKQEAYNQQCVEQIKLAYDGAFSDGQIYSKTFSQITY